MEDTSVIIQYFCTSCDCWHGRDGEYFEGHKIYATEITYEQATSLVYPFPRTETPPFMIVDELVTLEPEKETVSKAKFNCKTENCPNTQESKPFEGKICDTCWEQIHEDKECICPRCEEKRTGQIDEHKNYIIIDPEIVLKYEDWKSKGYKHIEKIKEGNNEPFRARTPENRKIIIFTIVQTRGNYSHTIDPETNKRLTSNSGYLCIAKNEETKWEYPMTMHGCQYDTFEEASTKILVYKNLL